MDRRSNSSSVSTPQLSMADVKARLNFSPSVQSPTPLPKRAPASHLTLSHRPGDYHMTKQNPAILDRLHSPRQASVKDPLIYKRPTYVPPPPTQYTRSPLIHNTSLLQHAINSHRSSQPMGTSLVQMAVRGSQRNGENGLASPVIVRLSGTGSALRPRGGEEEEHPVANPCDKDVIMSALKQRRKRKATPSSSSTPDVMAMDENSISVGPRAKKSKCNGPTSEDLPNGTSSSVVDVEGRKRPQGSQESFHAPLSKRNKGAGEDARPPSVLLRVPEVELDMEAEGERRTTESTAVANRGKNKRLRSARNASITPPVVEEGEEEREESGLKKKREDSQQLHRTLTTIFPSGSQASSGLRRKLPVFCATGSKPQLATQLTRTHWATDEDLRSDREALTLKVMQLLSEGLEDTKVTSPEVSSITTSTTSATGSAFVPLKDSPLGLDFPSVGAGIGLSLSSAAPLLTGGSTAGVVAGGIGVSVEPQSTAAFCVGGVAGISPRQPSQTSAMALPLLVQISSAPFATGTPTPSQQAAPAIGTQIGPQPTTGAVAKEASSQMASTTEAGKTQGGPPDVGASSALTAALQGMFSSSRPMGSAATVGAQLQATGIQFKSSASPQMTSSTSVAVTSSVATTQPSLSSSSSLPGVAAGPGTQPMVTLGGFPSLTGLFQGSSQQQQLLPQLGSQQQQQLPQLGSQQQLLPQLGSQQQQLLLQLGSQQQQLLLQLGSQQQQLLPQLGSQQQQLPQLGSQQQQLLPQLGSQQQQLPQLGSQQQQLPQLGSQQQQLPQLGSQQQQLLPQLGSQQQQLPQLGFLSSQVGTKPQGNAQFVPISTTQALSSNPATTSTAANKGFSFALAGSQPTGTASTVAGTSVATGSQPITMMAFGQGGQTGASSQQQTTVFGQSQGGGGQSLAVNHVGVFGQSQAGQTKVLGQLPQAGQTAAATMFGQPAQAPAANQSTMFGQPAQAPAVNQSTMFGQPAQAPAVNQSTMFGQPAQAPAANQSTMFGQPAQVPAAHQSTMFGQPAQAPAVNQSTMFGQPAQVPAVNQSTMFGQPAQVPAANQSTMFGQPAQAPAVNQSTMFGQPAQVPAAHQSTMFGQPAQASAANQSTMFGQPAQAPAAHQSTMFGQPAQVPAVNQSTMFGQPAQVPAANQSTMFGQPAQVPAANQFALFSNPGQSNMSAQLQTGQGTQSILFGQSQGKPTQQTLFGQPQAPANQPFTFGPSPVAATGQTVLPSSGQPFAFGMPQIAVPPTQGQPGLAASLFGQAASSNQQQQKQQLFMFGKSQSGQAKIAQTGQNGSIFGPSQPAQTGQNGSIFGLSQPAQTGQNGSIFSSSQPAQTGQAGSIFGPSQPAQTGQNGSIFGLSQPAQTGQNGSIFSSSQPAQTGQAGSIFGPSQPAQTGQNGSIFGPSQPAQTAQTGSIFGSSQPAQNAQPFGVIGGNLQIGQAAAGQATIFGQNVPKPAFQFSAPTANQTGTSSEGFKFGAPNQGGVNPPNQGTAGFHFGGAQVATPSSGFNFSSAVQGAAAPPSLGGQQQSGVNFQVGGGGYNFGVTQAAASTTGNRTHAKTRHSRGRRPA